MLSEKPVKRSGKRPGRKPSKIDVKAKLERSRQSARECRARKKLRYQYLEELVLNREQAIYSLRDELEVFKQWCIQVDNGIVTDKLLDTVCKYPATTSSSTSQGHRSSHTSHRSSHTSHRRSQASHTSTTTSRAPSQFERSGSQEGASRQAVTGAGDVAEDPEQQYTGSTPGQGRPARMSESHQVKCTESEFTSLDGSLYSTHPCMPVPYGSSHVRTLANLTVPVTTSSSMDYIGHSHVNIPDTRPSNAPHVVSTDCSVLPSYDMSYAQPSTSEGPSGTGTGKASWLSFLTEDLATGLPRRGTEAAAGLQQSTLAVPAVLPTVISDWSSDSSPDSGL